MYVYVRHIQADLFVCMHVYVCVCMCMYVTVYVLYASVCVSICMYCMYVYVFCLYLCFICMYGLDFQSAHHQVPKKQPCEAGPTMLDSVHPWACAHIISSVFGDPALD